MKDQASQTESDASEANEDLLNTRQVHERYSLHPHKARRLCRTGKIKGAYKDREGYWVIPESEIRVYLRDGGQSTLERLLENLKRLSDNPIVRLVAALTAIVGILAMLIGLLVDVPSLVESVQSRASPELTICRTSGHFCIAVAGLAQSDNLDDPHIGVELAQGVFLQLDQTFKKSELDFTVAALGPQTVGTIQGQSSDKRAREAALIADQLGADIILYGYVGYSEPLWQITPEFYVSANNFYEAQEITGQHDLGAPIPIRGKGSVADRIEISSELTSRTQALAQIVVGLAYYSRPDFEKALAHFKSAEAIQEWDDNEGRQVLHLLAGNAALKSNALNLAKEYYHKALQLDPDYARGYLGLAEVYYRLALKPFEDTKKPADTDQALLALAVDNYEKAMRASNQPPLADIPTKVHFGLGQAYFILIYSGAGESFDAAVTEFQAVIDEYGEGTNNRVQEIAAESHARLGLIYDLTGHANWAIDEYQLAISLLDRNPERQAEYEQRLRELIDSVKS